MRLKKHKSDQHKAVNGGLQAWRLTYGGGQVVFRQRDDLRHGDQEQRAQKHPMHRPQAANHNHQQQVNRLQDAELVG